MDARSWIPAVLAASLLLGGCGSDHGSEGDAGITATTPAARGPTKELLVQSLRDLLAAIEAGDYEKARTFLVPPSNLKPEDVPAALQSFVEKRDLSGPGIDILAEEGAFGTMDDLFGERGWSWAKRAGVDHKACWALTFDDAEVAAHWDGNAFRLLRLDDVGRLK